jgi:hypothetical protein
MTLYSFLKRADVSDKSTTSILRVKNISQHYTVAYLSYGMLRHVVWYYGTDVLEEFCTYIFRTEECFESIYICRIRTTFRSDVIPLRWIWNLESSGFYAVFSVEMFLPLERYRRWRFGRDYYFLVQVIRVFWIYGLCIWNSVYSLFFPGYLLGRWRQYFLPKPR